MQTKSPDATDIHVGSQIRLRRKSMQISQSMLADQLGITFQQVQKYEKGKNRVGASRLQGIAQILGVEVSFFFKDLASARQAITPVGENDGLQLRTFLVSPEGFALNQAFFKIDNPDTRKRIIALAKSLAEAPADQD
jgi:transcriptional regulator with XRE-family HTH domain